MGQILNPDIRAERFGHQLMGLFLQAGDFVAHLCQLFIVRIHPVGSQIGFLLAQGIQTKHGGVVIRHLLVAKRSTGARFIQQVDRLVGQKAVVDISFGKDHRTADDIIRHMHAVKVLVIALDAQQDLRRLLYGRLADLHGLKAPFECTVLFNVLAVLGKGGRADHLNFAAGKSGL